MGLWFTFVFVMLSSSTFAAVGGEFVAPGVFRQTVALTYKPTASEGEIYCSGTLIGPRLVLTAAHCYLIGARSYQTSLEDFKKHTWIYIGDSVNENKKPTVMPQFEPSEVRIFPQTGNMHSDLALIILREPVSLEAYQISPAPMGFPNNKTLGRELTAVGYGMIENQGRKGSKTQYSLPIRELNGYNGLGVGQPFTKGPGSCNGDSGGSAYMTNSSGQLLFIGVENSISNRPCGEAASYFVPLSQKILDWILESKLPVF